MHSHDDDIELPNNVSSELQKKGKKDQPSENQAFRPVKSLNDFLKRLS